MQLAKSQLGKTSKIVWKNEGVSQGALYSMLIPGSLILILFNYLPMAGIILAFKSYDYSKGILGSRWVGLKNFTFFFRTPDAYIITRNTILYNLAFIVLGTIISVIFAILLCEIANKFLSKSYQTIMLLPYFLSWVVVAYLLYAFLSSDYGFFNRSILPVLGLKPINWYNEPKYWPIIIIILNLWKSVGYNAVLYLATITSISEEYYEAASIDGATKFQQTIHITLPFLKPIITILTILALGKIFNSDFGLFFQVPMDSGALYSVTNVISTFVYRGMANSNIGMSAAAGLYQSVVGFVLVITSNYLVRKFDSENALY